MFFFLHPSSEQHLKSRSVFSCNPRPCAAPSRGTRCPAGTMRLRPTTPSPGPRRPMSNGGRADVSVTSSAALQPQPTDVSLHFFFIRFLFSLLTRNGSVLGDYAAHLNLHQLRSQAKNNVSTNKTCYAYLSLSLSKK